MYLWIGLRFQAKLYWISLSVHINATLDSMKTGLAALESYFLQRNVYTISLSLFSVIPELPIAQD